MMWAFLIQNWQEMGFTVLFAYFQWRYWRWYYVKRHETSRVESLNRKA